MRVLCVQHQDDGPPGAVGDWLAERGVRLEVLRPDLGARVPGTPLGYAGVLVLGGAMGAYDDAAAPWLPRVRELLASAVADSTPTLGICLGHQLLAAARGGEVQRHPAGRRMGTVRLGLETEAGGDRLFGALRPPYLAARWHQDVVTRVPADGRLLSTADGDVYGMRVGECAWGVQAHPEASAKIVAAWAERTEEALTDDGELTARVAAIRSGLEQVCAAEADLATSWRPFAHAFARVLADA